MLLLLRTLCACASPTLLDAYGHMHVSNNEEVAFNYMEVIFTCPRGGPTKIPVVKGTAHGNLKLFGTKIKVSICRCASF